MEKKQSYIKQPAKILEKYQPAVYETISEIVKEGFTEKFVDKAVFEEVEEDILVEPADTKWVYIKKAACESEDPLECMTLVEQTIPPKTQKIKHWKFISCKAGYEFDGSLCNKIIVHEPEIRTRQVLKEPAKKNKRRNTRHYRGI